MRCDRPFCHICGAVTWGQPAKPAYTRGITLRELLEPGEYDRILNDAAP